MSDPAALNENFDTMTATEFQDRLPELIAGGPSSLLEDERFAKFFADNPNSAALVRDLAAIAEAAKGLFDPDPMDEPSDDLWTKISNKLRE